MKNTVKLIGIIALAALIGFSLAACDNGGGGGGGGDEGGGDGGDSGNWPITLNEGNDWPSNTLLTKYQVSGMSKPSGSTFSYTEKEYENDFTLSIVFLPVDQHGTELRNWLKSNGFEESDYTGSDSVYCSLRNTTTGISAIYSCSLRPGYTTYAILSFSLNK